MSKAKKTINQISTKEYHDTANNGMYISHFKKKV